MRFLILALAVLGTAWAQPRLKLAIPEIHVFSTNVADDVEGVTDARAGTWGKQAYIDHDVPFVNVPTGKHVRITRFYGTFYAFPHGRVTDYTHAGVMAGLITKSTSNVNLVSGAGQSPFVAPGLGAKGCFMWIVDSIPEKSLIPFDYKIHGGLLDADNILVIRQAVFLNDTGVQIHMETTGIVEFEYE